MIAQVEKLLPLSQSQILRQMQNLIQSHEDFSNPYWPKAQDLHELCVIIVLLNGNMVQKKVQKYIRSLRIAFSHANLLQNVELYADIQTKGVNELYHHLLAMLYVITDHGKPLPTYKLSHYPILEPQEHKLLPPPGKLSTMSETSESFGHFLTLRDHLYDQLNQPSKRSGKINKKITLLTL